MVVTVSVVAVLHAVVTAVVAAVGLLEIVVANTATLGVLGQAQVLVYVAVGIG